MKLSTQILLAFSIVVLFSVADSYTNYRLSLKVERNTQFLSKSEAIIRNSNRIHKTIIEMQSGFRGYLLTEDAAFLESYYEGLDTVPKLIDEQKGFIKNSQTQYSILDSITVLHQLWINYANSLIQSRKQQSSESQKTYSELFENSLKNQVGKKINDRIRDKFSAFDKNEYKLRNIYAEELTVSIKRTHTFSFIFITLTVLVGAISTIYIVVIFSKRIKSMVGLAEKISMGKFSTVIDNRNDELTGLSRSLNTMSDKLRLNINELEKRNAELDKFAYVVSHDLKAPVRGVHNVVKWIEEDLAHELTPALKKYLAIIPQRTRRMEDLINGLLDYARVSQKTQISKIDVNKMANDIVELIVPRNFRVEIFDLPEMYAEPIKLEQVFTNLISNAVKYTPHEDGHIVITCNELQWHYQFSIKDNGIGIDPAYHQKIFEIFQTLREKDEIESTGVGLAIVKKIIDEQIGSINLNSQPGKGTEVIFTWQKKNN